MKKIKTSSPNNGHELAPAEIGLSHLGWGLVSQIGLASMVHWRAVAILQDHQPFCNTCPWGPHSNLPSLGAGLPDIGKRDVPHHWLAYKSVQANVRLWHSRPASLWCLLGCSSLIYVAFAQWNLRTRAQAALISYSSLTFTSNSFHFNTSDFVFTNWSWGCNLETFHIHSPSLSRNIHASTDSFPLHLASPPPL